MNLSQAKPALKQHNLNKLGHADESQSHCITDAAKNRLFMLFVYIEQSLTLSIRNSLKTQSTYQKFCCNH